jgi:hypothetical protein
MVSGLWKLRHFVDGSFGEMFFARLDKRTPQKEIPNVILLAQLGASHTE